MPTRGGPPWALGPSLSSPPRLLPGLSLVGQRAPQIRPKLFLPPHSTPQSEPQLCVGGMFFSLKKLIPYNKCFDLFLASTFYFFDVFNPVSLKGGVCGLYAYHKGGRNFF